MTYCRESAERGRVEGSLRESEARLRALARNPLAPSGACTTLRLFEHTRGFWGLVKTDWTLGSGALDLAVGKIRKRILLYGTISDVASAGSPVAVLVAATQLQRALAMTEAQPTIVVIDDDPDVRGSLGGLLRSVGLQVRLLASVAEFLKSGRPDGPTCLILDVRLPGRSGLDFQRELSAANIHIPIIFITGHADIPMTVQAMKGGAIEFLTKPFRDQDMLEAIQLGLARDRAWRENEKELAVLRARYDTLTPREREVMALVATGRLNKQIGGDIGISEITVKIHRGQVMRKMQASSLPDLARMADRLKLAKENSQTP